MIVSHGSPRSQDVARGIARTAVPRIIEEVRKLWNGGECAPDSSDQNGDETAESDLAELISQFLRNPSALLRLMDWLQIVSNYRHLYDDSSPFLAPEVRVRMISALQTCLHLTNVDMADAVLASRRESPASTSTDFTVLPPVRHHSRSRSDADLIHLSSNMSRLNTLSALTASLRSSHDNLPILSPQRPPPSVSQNGVSALKSPAPGQSLHEFLQMQDTETCVDMDRENAHFVICDAMIAATEKINYDLRHPELHTPPHEDSPTEAYIAVQELPRQSPRQRGATIRLEGTSVPGAMLSNSAESIALSVLDKMQKLRGSSADELDLGMPTLTCDTESSGPRASNDASRRIRGTWDWAPLRPQIIYNIQTHVMRQTGLRNQRGRCAGCGARMDSVQQTRVRYCEYTGKYFCVCCHEYKTSVIPGRILWKWDFTKYYVSNFAEDFIHRIYREPLFDISVCNEALYKRSRSLGRTKILRMEFVFSYEYIKSCRTDAACRIREECQQIPSVLFEEVHKYSLDMLVGVREGSLPVTLKPFVDQSTCHVLSCQDCSEKGFICEFCKDPQPLFPFQFSVVFRCSHCFSCYHSKCMKNRPCPKCLRMESRRSAV